MRLSIIPTGAGYACGNPWIDPPEPECSSSTVRLSEVQAADNAYKVQFVYRCCTKRCGAHSYSYFLWSRDQFPDLEEQIWYDTPCAIDKKPPAPFKTLGFLNTFRERLAAIRSVSGVWGGLGRVWAGLGRPYVSYRHVSYR